MNLDHDFVQVWKCSEDQKKNANGTLFSPNSGEDQKKKFSSKIEHFFPQFSLRCTPIQIIGGGCSQIIGGMYPPIPPCFGTPGRMPS